MKPTAGTICLLRITLALLALSVLPSGLARAQTTYKIQPILKVGDTVGGFTIPTGPVLYLGGLTDSGKLAIGVGAASGQKSELLVQHAEGKLTTLVGPGLEGPLGPWPEIVIIGWPFGMNQSGSIAFRVSDKGTPLGTFLWDDPAKKITTIAVKGMPAVNNLTFESGGRGPTVINNAGDLAFMADVLDTRGKPKPAIFFRGRDGKLQPVALPDEQLPGGARVVDPWLLSINDAGTVAFVSSGAVFLWEQGAITRVAAVGTDAPGGAKIKAIAGGWVNNRNRSVLVAASLSGSCCPAPFGLYRFAEGTLTALVVPGQEMPGGGKLKVLLWFNALVSQANDLGQHVFVATLDDGAQGVYLLDADGKVSLILKSGTMTEMGPLGLFATRSKQQNAEWVGVSLNNRGQVALVGRIGDGPDTVFLLTPTAP